MIENNDDKIKDLPLEASLLIGKMFGGDFCPLEVTYQENDLIKLSEQLKWQGSGTEHDPFIITASDGLAREFRILQSNFHIKFKECNFDIVWLRECKNISLEKISFKKFVLDKCREITIKECDIPFLSLADSQGNYFERSAISSAHNVRSSENTFRNCQFGEGITKILKKGIFSQAVIYVHLFTLVLGIGFFYFLISSDFTFTPDNAMYLIGFGGGFFLALFLCVMYWIGRAPSSNYIIVDEDQEE